MKKIAAIISAALLTAAMTTTAFAAPITQDTQDPKTASTNVSLNVDPTYSVVIPDRIVLDKQTDGTYAKDAEITATQIKLKNNQSIKVTIQTDFELETAEGGKLNYELSVGRISDKVSNNGEVANFSTSVNEDEQKSELHFTAGKPEFAGSYSDTAVFTVAVE